MPHSPLPSLPLTVLLVQARNTSDMEVQEQECFLERCRLQPEQLRTLNVPRKPIPPGILDDADALMIGGSGEHSATQDPAWMDDLLDLVRLAVRRRLPTFGSCWGHQIVARALGGTVVHDADHAEMGCHEVRLTDAGRRDELFRRLPPRFQANMGHHDRVSVLPPNAVELARNDQPNQAFRLRDAPVYGTQFHSELDAARERERLVAYREYYRQDLPDEKDFQRVLDSLADTTEVDALLYDFLTTYVVPASVTNAAESRLRVE